MTQEQVELIKRTIAKGADDDELELFLVQSKRLQLDPFSKQIFAVKRWDSDAGRKVMAIQLSIDAMRLIAARSGKYRGQKPKQWCGPDGVWKDIWLSSEPPAAARCGVMHADFSEPLYAVARWDSYVQKFFKKEGNKWITSSFWEKMPELMLGKTAESLALRMAFPNELSGLYGEDEIGGDDELSPELIQAQREAENAAVWRGPTPTGDPTNEELTKLASDWKKTGWTGNDATEYMRAMFNKQKLTELKRPEFEIFTEEIKQPFMAWKVKAPAAKRQVTDAEIVPPTDEQQQEQPK